MRDLFRVPQPILGMLHLPALPGSPACTLTAAQIRMWVLHDAAALVEGGVDALILENFGDAPFYPDHVPPHTVAFMAVLGAEVKSRFDVPLGINVLRNDAIGALAIATAVGAEFIRVNVYTGARLTDQGIVQGVAHDLLRYRKLLGSPVRVFADVAVKHSAPLAARTLEEEVEDTVFRGRADAVIISGSATGKETRVEDIQGAKQASGGAPVLVGSGASLASVAALLSCSDGLIVGTALKESGIVANPVDPARVAEFMRVVQASRKDNSRGPA